MKIAIIGGGPIGMEAALYGASAGFDVTLYERGRIADNVRAWGHVGVFTEWARNRSPLAVRLLEERGISLPPADTTSTGDELASYVARLASLPELRGRVWPQTQVLAVTRERTLRSDFIGDARREQRPFRLLLNTPKGEVASWADAVIDATGVYSSPNFAGNGGAPCPGERSLASRIDYHIPDVAGRDRARFAGKATLVVGSGHSAASTLRAVGDLLDSAPGTRLAWAVRRGVPKHGSPYSLIPNDSSPHREALHRRANELARDERVDFRHSTVVDALAHNGKRFVVTLLTTTAGEESRDVIEVDNIAAHTGFRPDEALWSELTVQVHPATGAVLRLGEALVKANHKQGVGLSTGYAEKQPQAPVTPDGVQGEDSLAKAVDKWKFSPSAPELLLSGEPGFFVIGIKSYGRDAGFLMQNGFRQVRSVYQLLSGEAGLDLYNGALD
jgi:hypothetical protein